MDSGGQLTYFFWRSAYLSMCFSSKSFSSIDRGNYLCTDVRFQLETGS